MACTLLGWPDQGLAMDVAVHVGTLAAVLWYFRRELKPLTRATLRAPLDWRQQGRLDAHARLGIGVAIATIPVGLAGLLLHDTIATHLRAPLVIAAATIGFGLSLSEDRTTPPRGSPIAYWPEGVARAGTDEFGRARL